MTHPFGNSAAVVGLADPGRAVVVIASLLPVLLVGLGLVVLLIGHGAGAA